MKGEHMLISDIKSREDLINLAIAQDDDNDYSESGYIVVTDGKEAAIAHYSHCSCYGTWTSLSDRGAIQWDWKGSLRQLKKLAVNGLDLHDSFGNRKADEKDYDYDHLMNVYQQVIKWFEDRKKKRKKN